ncbi:MAG: multiple sugar transport system permease protein [Hyphomicrobiaceae bacterium]|jgi:multiple sugar transport system permease protein
MVLLRKYLPKRAYKAVEATLFHLMLWLVIGPFFFIFFFMFWNSLKPDYLFFEPGTWIFEPLWENYTDVYENSDLIGNIINSLIISGSATFIGLCCGIMSSYTIARFGLKKLSLAILLTRMVPFITALVPFWIVYKHLGLLNTHVGIILAHLVITLPIAVWIMMGFMEDIPRELEEAAWIDGASRSQAFFRIVLPLATPGMVATAILVFIFSWNNFAFALILGGFDVSTAPVSVFKYADPEAGGSGQMMAAATMVTIPVFIIVLAIQRQLTAGLTMGGVKG